MVSQKYRPTYLRVEEFNGNPGFLDGSAVYGYKKEKQKYIR
jgi:hypothetical protein